MDIRSGLDGLKSLLGVMPQTVAPTGTSVRNGSAAEAPAVGSDRATLSNAASEMAQLPAGDEVRAGKVAGIQAALAAGTYNVSASAVASRVVDSMLAVGR
jgi:negative regulator of flagellin synthesis FlgM